MRPTDFHPSVSRPPARLRAAAPAAARRAGRRLRPVSRRARWRRCRAAARAGAGRIGRRGAARGTTLGTISVKAQRRDRQELGARDDQHDRPRQPGAARHSAVGDGGHREADRRPPRRHREGSAALHRRHHLPGRRGRRGRHPPARLLAARPAATSTSTASATRRSTTATSSTSTASRCCAARRRCCSAAARPAAWSTRSASSRCSPTSTRSR